MAKSNQVDMWIVVRTSAGWGSIRVFHATVASEKQFLCDKNAELWPDGSVRVYGFGRNRRISRDEVVLTDVPFGALASIFTAEREYLRWNFDRTDVLREELRPIEAAYRAQKGAVESAYNQENHEHWQDTLRKFEAAIEQARKQED